MEVWPEGSARRHHFGTSAEWRGNCDAGCENCEWQPKPSKKPQFSPQAQSSLYIPLGICSFLPLV